MSKLCSFFHAFGTLPIRWRIVSFFFGMFYEFLSLVLVGFAFCFYRYDVSLSSDLYRQRGGKKKKLIDRVFSYPLIHIVMLGMFAFFMFSLRFLRVYVLCVSFCLSCYWMF